MVYPVGVVDNYLLIVDGVDSGESEPHHLDYAPDVLPTNIPLYSAHSSCRGEYSSDAGPSMGILGGCNEFSLE